MLLMTLCAVPCAWIGANLRQWQAEQRVLAAIGPAAIVDPGQLKFCFL